MAQPRTTIDVTRRVWAALTLAPHTPTPQLEYILDIAPCEIDIALAALIDCGYIELYEDGTVHVGVPFSATPRLRPPVVRSYARLYDLLTGRGQEARA